MVSGVGCTLRWGTQTDKGVLRGERKQLLGITDAIAPLLPADAFQEHNSLQGTHSSSPALDHKKEQSSSPSTLSVDCFHAWHPKPKTTPLSGQRTLHNSKLLREQSPHSPHSPPLGRSFQMSFHLFFHLFSVFPIILLGVPFHSFFVRGYISLSPIGDYVSGIEV